MRGQFSFTIGMKFHGIFVTGDEDLADFSGWEGAHRVCDSGLFSTDLSIGNLYLGIREHREHHIP